MKRLLGMIVAAAVMAGGALVWADNCCPSSATKKKADAACPMTAKKDSFAKLNLTEDQRKKVAALREQCDKAGRSQEACQKFMTELKSVLTPEQWAKWEEACKASPTKAGASCGSCPVSHGAKK